MAFGLSSYTINCMGSYEDVLGRFENLYTEKKDPNRRFVGRRYNRSQMAIRRGTSFYFRYHRTDVVVWHSPTSLSVTPWDSQSTGVFADCFVPSGVRAFTRGHNFCLRINGSVFPLKDTAHLVRKDGKWEIANPEEACVRYKKIIVDRALAKPAVKLAKDYLDWAKMAKRGESIYTTPNRVKRAGEMLVSKEFKFTEIWRDAGHCKTLVHAAAAAAGATKVVPLEFGANKPKSVYEDFV